MAGVKGQKPGDSPECQSPSELEAEDDEDDLLHDVDDLQLEDES